MTTAAVQFEDSPLSSVLPSTSSAMSPSLARSRRHKDNRPDHHDDSHLFFTPQKDAARQQERNECDSSARDTLRWEDTIKTVESEGFTLKQCICAAVLLLALVVMPICLPSMQNNADVDIVSPSPAPPPPPPVSQEKEAELIRQNAEEARQRAERERTKGESSRVSGENTRLASEKTRVSGENTRLSSERERLSEEQARVSSELERVSGEKRRIDGEVARDSAEEKREKKERDRISAEEERANAELRRGEKERERAESEISRRDAENSRNANEQDREEAEEKRERDMRERRVRFDDMIKQLRAAEGGDASSGDSISLSAEEREREREEYIRLLRDGDNKLRTEREDAIRKVRVEISEMEKAAVQRSSDGDIALKQMKV